MKQLLQSYSDTHLAAGLNDHVFLVVANGDSPVVYELLPPTVKDDPAQDKTQNQNEKDYEPHEVQAVAIHHCSDERIWCAVSRRNKTLSLYEFSTTDKTKTTLSPTTTHKTSKRVCCLSFSTVPPSTLNGSSFDVIIAGDLVGDAIAYPLVAPDPVSDAARGNDDSNASMSRLLLGHTASVLTGVKTVKDGSVQRILTSDRDEKVRVSQFPQTAVIEGYLLGHTAFIAAMDVATDPGCHQCVTCSGDGTIRLWNYETCKPVAQIRIPNADGMNGAEENTDKDGDRESASLVPTAISMTPNGSHVAVIFYKCPSVFIYAIVEGEMKQHQTIDCQQPLAVRFVDNQNLFVVGKEPHFLLRHKWTSGKFDICSEDAICHALSMAASKEGIVMPETLLETDRKGKARLKLKEKDERAHQKPWNNVERIKIAKERSARRRKRRRDEEQAFDKEENVID